MFNIFYLLILYILFSVFQIYSKRLFQHNYYFDEFYSGLKQNKKSRCYATVFMLQRILSSIVLIVLANINYETKVGLFTAVQVVVLVYLLLIRPQIKVKDLIMEIYSQLTFTLFSGLLIHFKTESKWNALTNWLFLDYENWKTKSLYNTIIILMWFYIY